MDMPMWLPLDHKLQNGQQRKMEKTDNTAVYWTP